MAPSRIGGRGRIAMVVLHAGPVVISRPRHGGDRTDPPQLTLNMVEAREINGPAGAQALLWRLLTTLNVTSAADAQEIVRLYRLRWRIEEIFRALKRGDMRLEETQRGGGRTTVQAGPGRPRRSHPHTAIGRCP